MTLKECITEIVIRKICPMDYFDAHLVINELIHNKNYYETYLRDFSSYSSVSTYHSDISKIIKSLSEIVEPIEGISKSHTIFGNIEGVSLYRKK